MKVRVVVLRAMVRLVVMVVMIDFELLYIVPAKIYEIFVLRL